MTYFGVNSMDGVYSTPSDLLHGFHQFPPNSQSPEDPEVELYVPNLPEFFNNPPPPLQEHFADHQTIPIYTASASAFDNYGQKGPSPGTAPYYWPSPPPPSLAYHEGQRQEEHRSTAPSFINSASVHSDEQQDPNEEWFGNDEEKKMASERYTKNYERINAILSETKISYQPPSMKRVESLRNTVVLLEKQIEKEREELNKTKEKCDSQMKEFKDNTAQFYEQLANLRKPVSDEIYEAMVEKHYNELKKKLELDPSGKLGPCCCDDQEECRTMEWNEGIFQSKLDWNTSSPRRGPWMEAHECILRRQLADSGCPPSPKNSAYPPTPAPAPFQNYPPPQEAYEIFPEQQSVFVPSPYYPQPEHQHHYGYPTPALQLPSPLQVYEIVPEQEQMFFSPPPYPQPLQSSFTVHDQAYPAPQLQQDNHQQEGAAQLSYRHNRYMFLLQQKYLAEKNQLGHPQHQMMVMQPGHSVRKAPSHRWKSRYVPHVSAAAAGGASPLHQERISMGIELPSNFPTHRHVKKVRPNNRLLSGGGVVEVVLPPKPSPLGNNWTTTGGQRSEEETTSSNGVRSCAPTLVSLLEAPCLNPAAGSVDLYSCLTGGEGIYQEGEHEHVQSTENFEEVLNGGPAAGVGGDGEIESSPTEFSISRSFILAEMEKILNNTNNDEVTMNVD